MFSVGVRPIMDRSPRAGSTVYGLDSAFRFTHPVLAQEQRSHPLFVLFPSFISAVGLQKRSTRKGGRRVSRDLLSVQCCVTRYVAESR